VNDDEDRTPPTPNIAHPDAGTGLAVGVGRVVADPSATTRSADPASAAPASERGTIRSATPIRDPDRYEILGEHGRGGLGRVSRAHDKDRDATSRSRSCCRAAT
jgi:hypothetical protein